jgi:hypothetical protein
MQYDVLEARYIDGYRVWLRFRDGTQGEVDFRSHIRGFIFQPLKDLSFFRRFRVDPELQTLSWPNGADIAPETLYDEVRAA